MPIVVQKRNKGTTVYTLGRKVSVLVNSLTSFSSRPLVLIFYLGCLICVLSGVAATYLVVRWLAFGRLLAGWPSLIVSVWMLGGLTIFCVGIIGIYLSKIFTETKRRPYTIIRRRYRHEREG
jgi:putative glycosyltransferase